MSWIKVSIKGRVVDEKGNPVSYAIVKVSKRIGPPYEVRAELDGSFHSWTPPFTAYDKKKIVKVSISKLGYKPVKLDIDVSKCSTLEEVDLGEIVLESLPEIATIKGVVFDEKTGKSLRDILVKLKKNGISLDEYVTGNDGMFAFKVVEPGKYEIEASTTERIVDMEAGGLYMYFAEKIPLEIKKGDKIDLKIKMRRTYILRSLG